MTEKTNPPVEEVVAEPEPLPAMPERFTNGGATAEERAKWIAENWPAPPAEGEGSDPD